MKEILEFAGKNQVAFLCAVWLIVDVVGSIVIRTCRCIQVTIRGLPPPHLDADGDWPTPPETEEQPAEDAK